MSVDWTPDQYEYSQEYNNQEENASSTTAYSDNPDWYYEEDGGYQSCLGALPKGEQPTQQGVYIWPHARAHHLLAEWDHKIGFGKSYLEWLFGFVFFFFQLESYTVKTGEVVWDHLFHPQMTGEASEAEGSWLSQDHTAS